MKRLRTTSLVVSKEMFTVNRWERLLPGFMNEWLEEITCLLLLVGSVCLELDKALTIDNCLTLLKIDQTVPLRGI